MLYQLSYTSGLGGVANYTPWHGRSGAGVTQFTLRQRVAPVIGRRPPPIVGFCAAAGQHA